MELDQCHEESNKNLHAQGRAVGRYHTLRLSLFFCYQIALDALKFSNDLLVFAEVVELLNNPIDLSIKQKCVTSFSNQSENTFSQN